MGKIFDNSHTCLLHNQLLKLGSDEGDRRNHGLIFVNAALIRILLPVAAPGIVTTLIFIFINAGNEYTVALTLISTDTSKLMTVGINIFNGYNMIE